MATSVQPLTTARRTAVVEMDASESLPEQIMGVVNTTSPALSLSAVATTARDQTPVTQVRRSTAYRGYVTRILLF